MPCVAIPYFRKFKLVRVCSLVGRYFCNVFLVTKFENVFSVNVKDTYIIYVHVYIILDFPITYRNTSVLCQSECACLHKTVNLIVFLVKSNETTYPKGKAFMQMYRVVPIKKRGNSSSRTGVHLERISVFNTFGSKWLM